MDAKSIARNSLFERTGQIIFGDRFVGRKYEIEEIRKHVLDNRANVAIVGMPRVGKSSLAWESLMSIKDSLIKERKIIPIYIDVSTIANKSAFFAKMTSKAMKEIRKLHCTKNNEILIPEEDIAYLLEMSKSVETEGEECLNNMFYDFYEDFYQITKCQLVYILDEFDKTQKIFEAPDFLLLRETAYTPETNLSYVTISRKSIKEIETKDKQNLSNFHGTFNKYIHLNVFTNQDLALYWNRITSVLDFSEDDISNIEYIAGNHPLFLDLCCIHLLSNSNIPLTEHANLREKLYDEFNQIVEMLNDKGLSNTAKQAVIGPPQSIDKQDIDKLLDFGFLKIVTSQTKANLLSLTCANKDENAYVLFSDYFTLLYYFKYFLDSDYWPQWGITENKIRYIVEEFLKARFGNNWIEKVAIDNVADSDWTSRWNTLLDRYSKNKRMFFNGSINSPITVAETGELYYQFIKRYWDLWFSKVFTPVKDDELLFSNSVISSSSHSWEEIFGFLMKIRRPFAHTNTFILGKEDEVIAKGYCELVLNKIAFWEENKHLPKYIEIEDENPMCGKINHDKTKIFCDSHPAYIIDKNNGFALGFTTSDYNYQANDEVLFDLRKTTNPRTGAPFSLAINVRPASKT